MSEKTILDSGEKLAALERVIGYEFLDKNLIREALTHSSFSREEQAQLGKKSVAHPDYERLEFLGDAVLELTTSRMLYDRYDWPEGKLTKTRAKIVCEASLSMIARLYDLGSYLVLGHGEEKTGGRERDSILCDIVESIIGAVYLDGGLGEAKRLIVRMLFDHLDELPDQPTTDYKSVLQEKLQGEGKPIPEYKVALEYGPPHDRTFVIDLYLEGKRISRAEGHSKKQAAQEAAHEAMMILEQGARK